MKAFTDPSIYCDHTFCEGKDETAKFMHNTCKSKYCHLSLIRDGRMFIQDYVYDSGVRPLFKIPPTYYSRWIDTNSRENPANIFADGAWCQQCNTVDADWRPMNQWWAGYSMYWKNNQISEEYYELKNYISEFDEYEGIIIEMVDLGEVTNYTDITCNISMIFYDVDKEGDYKTVFRRRYLNYEHYQSLDFIRKLTYARGIK